MEYFIFLWLFSSLFHYSTTHWVSLLRLPLSWTQQRRWNKRAALGEGRRPRGGEVIGRSQYDGLKRDKGGGGERGSNGQETFQSLVASLPALLRSLVCSPVCQDIAVLKPAPTLHRMAHGHRNRIISRRDRHSWFCWIILRTSILSLG